VRTQSHPWNTELLLSGKVPKNILSNKFNSAEAKLQSAEAKLQRQNTRQKKTLSDDLKILPVTIGFNSLYYSYHEMV